MDPLRTSPLAAALALTLTAASCSGPAGTSAGAAAAGSAAHPAPAARPDVVFITVDTLRADRLGSYGSAGTRTPALDALAAGGVRFERAYAPLPKTNPSLSSMMTGRYPSAHGVRRNGAHLPESELTLAELLKAAGYATAAFVSNHVMQARHGLAQGFDLYDQDLPDPIPTRIARERTAKPLVDRVLSWAAAAPARPFFLWVHFIDPHGPYTPPGYRPEARAAAGGGRTLPVAPGDDAVDAIPAYQALPGVTEVEEYLARYGAEVEHTDAQAGRLIEGLREKGLLDRALVVFAADHGESLGDHGLYFQHGSSLYEPQIRIPLVVAGPEIAAGVVAEPVSLVDVTPTVLERLGLPQHQGIQGRSLGPFLEGERPRAAEGAAPRLLIAELGDRRAAISGSLKLIWDITERRTVLHDMAADPDETGDAAASHAEEGRLLLETLQAFARENRRDEAGDTDEETVRILKSLGYVE